MALILFQRHRSTACWWYWILKRKYAIPAANFIGHSDIAPTRKVDPNIHFPWKLLADRGFGLWWNDTTSIQVPDHFNAIQALRIVGL
jgi:N-acetylmuramoyl-L-alanine amidase